MKIEKDINAPGNILENHRPTLLLIKKNGQNIFELPFIPKIPQNVILYLNNRPCVYGDLAEYTITNNILTWIGFNGHPLEVTDKLVYHYMHEHLE